MQDSEEIEIIEDLDFDDNSMPVRYRHTDEYNADDDPIDKIEIKWQDR